MLEINLNVDSTEDVVRIKLNFVDNQSNDFTAEDHRAMEEMEKAYQNVSTRRFGY